MSQKRDRRGRDFDIQEVESTIDQIPIRIHSKLYHDPFKKYLSEKIRQLNSMVHPNSGQCELRLIDSS
jgi:hypothetical protein